MMNYTLQLRQRQQRRNPKIIYRRFTRVRKGSHVSLAWAVQYDTEK